MKKFLRGGHKMRCIDEWIDKVLDKFAIVFITVGVIGLGLFLLVPLLIGVHLLGKRW